MGTADGLEFEARIVVFSKANRVILWQCISAFLPFSHLPNGKFINVHVIYKQCCSLHGLINLEFVVLEVR